MILEKRVDAFARIGDIMRQAAEGKSSDFTNGLIRLIRENYRSNPWFTPENVQLALAAFGAELNYSQLNKWVSMYPELENSRTPKTIAVVMAGNIPMVGFHDMVSVLLTGNKLIAKTSSKDDLIIKELASILIRVEPGFDGYVAFTDELLKDFDAAIATGSDNTSRYFEYYFGRYQSLIRKNRTGVALLTGNEASRDLADLGWDVFSYFGLGCRNVTKLYLPDGFDFEKLKLSWTSFGRVAENIKYRNNYEHNKAVAIINREQFHDFGFVLLREDKAFFSPVGVVNYEFISAERFEDMVKLNEDKIQVIVSGGKHTRFGLAQKPILWDYSDGIDTMEFLLKIN